MGDQQDERFDGEWVSTDLIALLTELGVRNLHRYFGCVLLAQGGISDDLRDLLMRESVSLVCLRQTRSRIKTDWCEGELKTEFASATLESLSGIKFECRMDVGNKTTKATFIITSSLLDLFPAAAWLRKEYDHEEPLKRSWFN